MSVRPEEDWPNVLPVVTKAIARGSPNAAMKLAKEMPIGSIAPHILLKTIAYSPTSEALSTESNFAVASMAMDYKDWLMYSGAFNVGSKNGEAIALSEGYSGGDRTGLYTSTKDLIEAFGGLSPKAGWIGAGGSSWMLHESKMSQVAKWWKTNMAKTAAVADVNAVYFIRFAYERIMAHAVLQNKTWNEEKTWFKGVSRPDTSQFIFFAQKFLGFTPGTDWRRYPSFITKY